MGDTPRVDGLVNAHHAEHYDKRIKKAWSKEDAVRQATELLDFARQLERELAERTAELQEMQSDRQREHDLRVRLAGSVEALESRLTRQGVWVPREPTEEMLRAGHGTMFVDVRYSRAANIVKRGYKAMLDAAIDAMLATKGGDRHEPGSVDTEQDAVTGAAHPQNAVDAMLQPKPTDELRQD